MTTDLANLLRTLAEWTAPAGTGVLSIYIDARPQASGEDPGRRKDEIVVKDRLRALERSLGPRGPARDSFLSDRVRIEEALAGDLRGADGVAIFACSAGGLFEVVRAGAPFDVRVAYGPRPSLYQLARLVDEYEPAVVAVADTNTLRLFAVRWGRLSEEKGRDEDPISFQKRATGGFSQARYQRHVEKHRKDFAEEAANAIAALVDAEGARRLVLAGDEVAIPPLRDALPRKLLEKLAGDAIRIHIRAGTKEIASEVAAVLAEAEARSSRAIADQLVGEVLADDLGVHGIDASRAALDAGQGDVLVLSDSFGPREVRDELVRLALQTGATVEVVEGHAGLESLDGVGVLLRFRH